MSDPTTRLVLEELGQALARLREAVEEPIENPLAIDGTIQRFEFSIELFWKLLRRLLGDEGIHVATPREALCAAFKTSWLGNEELWLAMLDDRNRTSHTYKRDLAEQIYGNIKTYLPELESVLVALTKRAS